MTTPIPPEYRGWWRIVDTGTWVNDGLDIPGPALLSLTGSGDRLRMYCLLGYVNARPTKTGVPSTAPSHPSCRGPSIYAPQVRSTIDLIHH